MPCAFHFCKREMQGQAQTSGDFLACREEVPSPSEAVRPLGQGRGGDFLLNWSAILAAGATFALPRGVPAARAAEALRALDSQTPPEVTVEGETLRIRYNSMRVAPGNFAYTLRTLANPGKEPTP